MIMKLFNMRNTIAAIAVAMFALTGAAFAQNQNEYRDWQREQSYGRAGYLPNAPNCPVDSSPKWDPNAQAWGCINNYPTRSERNPRNAPNCPVGTSPKWDPAALAWGCVDDYYMRNDRNYRGNDQNYQRNDQNYRVYRNGSYYETDNRGAELLRQAVQSGYNQGYTQGRQDRSRGRSMNYYGNDLYSNGTYGYQSYVARDQYQYYFQQGFERGYQDGYNSTSRYGSRSGNTFNILGSVLNTILNLRQN
jgi:hypothetical protein